MKIIPIIIFIFVSITASASHPGGKQMLTEWEMISSTQVSQTGDILSSRRYEPQKWIKTTVPTTVLGTLVKAGIYPDPHFDLNDLRIPDASDDLNQRLGLSKYSYLDGVDNPFKDPYWFRTTFTIPASQKGRRTWLNFDGINYRADVWVNGRQIVSAKEMAGMFLRFQYDISQYVDYQKENVIAVRIHQVDNVGTPSPGYMFEPFGPGRGQGEEIFRDVTLKFMAGWDCAPVVRDRNMGMYQDVYLTYTGDVKIENPYIVTDLHLPDTTNAYITVSAELRNTTHSTQKGILRGTIDLLKEIDFYTYKKQMPGDMRTIVFEKEVEIPAGQNIEIAFTPQDFEQLHIRNPYLWWPNGYGRQYLHTLNLTFETKGKESDTFNTTFGIRKITSTLKEIDGEFGRIFWVNGKRIFSRGGFIQPDMMLDMNKKRMYDEARLLALSGVNMIANEDMPSPPEHVMETYDKYGLLVWEVFFQCWTSYPGMETFNNPVDTELALRNMYDVVRRYRNHPSLVLWCMQIETIVREELYVPLREYIRHQDPTRPFIATSSHGWDIDKLTPYMKPDLPTGMTDENEPDYTWYPHAYYYEKVLEVKDQMFRNEMGVPAVSTLASMKKYINDLGKGERTAIYPLDRTWAYHDAWDTIYTPSLSYAYKPYDIAIRKQFGQPESAEDYIRWAQYINAGSYRAMYEAANHRMWDITSGVMLWKLNATWPQVLWQIYDWFLNPNAGFYYAKKALEPLHIQMNEHNRMISVINTIHTPQTGLNADVKVYDFGMNIVWQKQQSLSIGEDCFQELYTVPQPPHITPVYFVRLLLTDKDGKIVSENIYWLSADGENDFRAIAQMPKVDLNLTYHVLTKDDDVIIKAKVRNPTDRLAFMHRLMITKGSTGEEVWPTFWSDNFLTLFPGDEREVTAIVSRQDLDGTEPFLRLDTDQ
ncbi:beta-mannosidase [Proteiniphilum sp. X52]|nr:beta-mannosidase [Proteiniphilum sp. X52]